MEEQGSDVYAGRTGTLVNTLLEAHNGKLTTDRKYIMGKQKRIIRGLRMRVLDEDSERDEDAIPWDINIPF